MCDYSEVEDPTHETVEMFEAAKVARWVRGLVSSGTIVMAKRMVEVFSANFWPNLVSHLGSFPFFVIGCWLISFISTAYALVQLPFPPPLPWRCRTCHPGAGGR